MGPSGAAPVSPALCLLLHLSMERRQGDLVLLRFQTGKLAEGAAFEGRLVASLKCLVASGFHSQNSSAFAQCLP